MTKFCVFCRTQATTANFLNLYSEFNALFYIQFRGTKLMTLGYRETRM